MGRYRMSNLLTTILEVGGALAVTAGVGLLLGVGAALIVAGVLAIAASWVVSR